jgi:hypothetical protein
MADSVVAGVSLGPFPDYKSRFLGGSAAELFDVCPLSICAKFLLT